MSAMFSDNPVVTVVSSSALVAEQLVTLSVVSGQLTATPVTSVGHRPDAIVERPSDANVPTTVRLLTGKGIQTVKAGGTITAGQVVFAAATGRVLATGDGDSIGIALEGGANGQDILILAREPRQRGAVVTASAGDATNGFVNITHNLGANPTFVIAQARSSAGAVRTVANVTFPDTNTLRITVTSLAAADVVCVLYSPGAF